MRVAVAVIVGIVLLALAIGGVTSGNDSEASGRAAAAEPSCDSRAVAAEQLKPILLDGANLLSGQTVFTVDAEALDSYASDLKHEQSTYDSAIKHWQTRLKLSTLPQILSRLRP